MPKTELISEKLESLPALPGIYQFLDKNEKVIYIGKAKNLRNRVRSYFNKNLDSPKTQVMVEKVSDLTTIITDSEIEALVLEASLVKELKPRYNINLKDDKSFPYIRVTNEPYPRIFSTREIIRDGSKYFGPYTDVKNMKASLRMINKIFKIRSCNYWIDDEVIEKKKIKVCLDYHIKKCDGPCEGLITEKDYGKMVNEVIRVLKGKTDDLITELEVEMLSASKNLKFEKAAELRDKLEQLKVYTAKQNVVSTEKTDRDILSIALEDKDVACTILNIRNGRLVGKKQLAFQNMSTDKPEEIYSQIIKRFYAEYVEIPKELIVETEPEDREALENWLTERAEGKVRFIIPQRKSEAKSLIEMSKRNSQLQLKEIQLQRMKKEGQLPHVIAALKRDLRLKNVPRLIECFDISNLQGTDTVASMVVFEDGKPKKSLYRKFKINSVDSPNDFASMREVVERRYKRVLEENQKFPDLIMVDGGKGQLSSAVEILKRIAAPKFEIIGLAKRLEEVFLPGISEAQTIPKTSSSLKLLQHIRDEAHRFAITFHRDRRSKRTFTTELLDIEGIGPKIAEKLLTEFKSLNEIKSLSEEELAKVIGGVKAKKIKDYYENPV